MTDRILSSAVSKYVDKEVTISGWAQSIRTHSKVVFFDLRDRDGIIQVVFQNHLLDKVKGITEESVVTIIGTVAQRPQSLVNPNLISGEIEVQASEIEIITLAKPLPFPLNDTSVSEENRLKYRYLDIRSAKTSNNIKMRHKINHLLASRLSEKGFIGVETPYLSKSTPEGARDYLVPSRLDAGKFYALPQSPQQYKQLLMVGGLERYFQIVRCFRDEDTRGDRQPEFTQLDIEMSFPTQEEILNLIEELMKDVVKKLYPEKTLTFEIFPRLRYEDVMKEHKSDRPDLRKTKNDDELAFAFVVDFPLFEWKEQENRFDATHHPFTSPQKEYEDNFEEKPKEAKAYQYDLILNGYEIGGGSIRIHKTDVLERVFKFMGHPKEKIYEQFGHLLEAFEYGVPPHGGIALGLDRLNMILQKEDTIREVIAFPKTGEGKDLMMNAPSSVDNDQLKELHLEIKK